MYKIIVNLKTDPYPIFIGRGVSEKLPRFLADKDIGNYAVVITQRKIVSLHKGRIGCLLKGIPYRIVYVPQGETAKSQEWAFRIIETLLSENKGVLKKRIFLVCLGGGVVGDVGGFIASIYKRGIPFIQVPTTLLAQVDASIGGKTAINVRQAKNMVGTFYQPQAVFIDPEFITTLPKRELRQGFAEVIKYAAIKDKDLFTFLDKNSSEIQKLVPRYLEKIITRCAQIKAEIVSCDEKEKKGLRTILNFGHTIGHALEAALCYRRDFHHGEGVALGMICAAGISVKLGLCSQSVAEKLADLIKKYSLPVTARFDTQKVLASLTYDKKFVRGSIRMVLLTFVGKTRVCSRINLADIKKSLLKIKQ